MPPRTKTKYLLVSEVEEIYNMPASTQKTWRGNGKFKENIDWEKIGPTIGYFPARLKKHPLLKQYTADKKATS